MEEEQALRRYTRFQLKKVSIWANWKAAAEKAQLDDMEKKGMYEEPCLPPEGAIILGQHWTYSFKPLPEGFKRKARNCCNGSAKAALVFIWRKPMHHVSNNHACVSSLPWWHIMATLWFWGMLPTHLQIHHHLTHLHSFGLTMPMLTGTKISKV